MITPGYAVRRSIQRAGWALDRLGLAVRRIQTPTSSAAGFSFQWRKDPQGNIRGTIVDRMIGGKRIWFFVHDDSDLIQGYHLRGKFYETEELALIAPHFAGGLFVDIGANVGNHSIYAFALMGAERVIAFEPNPQAYRVLEINAQLNGFGEHMAIHRVGLSDKPSRAKVLLPYANLGGGWLEEEDDGAIEIVVGDTILADEPVRFIKIDTEGMELRVLDGLRETVARHKPTLFIEVMDRQIPEFEAWCATMGYRTETTYKRYRENTNYLVVPETSASKPAKRRAPRKSRDTNGG